MSTAGAASTPPAVGALQAADELEERWSCRSRDGPTSATISPVAHVEADVGDRLEGAAVPPPRRVGERDLAQPHARRGMALYR